MQAAPDPFEHAVRLAEAAIFASREPVTTRVIANLIPEDADADAVLAALAARYAGRGVNLAEVAGGWQFRTAPDLAAVLRRVVELPRRLPRAAMETLAIVAYHQPVTRTEIEEIRGASLSQNTFDLLLENGLITAAGRRETPGRPTIWATTPDFLSQFGLTGLKDLPRREELLVEPADTPGVDTPGMDAPGVDTPGVDTPGMDMPGVDTPGMDTTALAVPPEPAP